MKRIFKLPEEGCKEWDELVRNLGDMYSGERYDLDTVYDEVLKSYGSEKLADAVYNEVFSFYDNMHIV